MPPSTSATMRLARDKVLVLVMALANSPLMPADRAASFGLWLAAVDASPKPVTITKAYGTRNMNSRKATAAASTPPPLCASRSTALNAVSMDAESARRASMTFRVCWAELRRRSNRPAATGRLGATPSSDDDGVPSCTTSGSPSDAMSHS